MPVHRLRYQASNRLNQSANKVPVSVHAIVSVLVFEQTFLTYHQFTLTSPIGEIDLTYPSNPKAAQGVAALVC